MPESLLYNGSLSVWIYSFPLFSSFPNDYLLLVDVFWFLGLLLWLTQERLNIFVAFSTSFTCKCSLSFFIHFATWCYYSSGLFLVSFCGFIRERWELLPKNHFNLALCPLIYIHSFCLSLYLLLLIFLYIKRLLDHVLYILSEETRNNLALLLNTCFPLVSTLSFLLSFQSLRKI